MADQEYEYEDEEERSQEDGYEEERSRKKQKKLTITFSKLTNVATKILLDDAAEGFKNGNFVCSPFSLEILLGMLAAGAEGETLKQLLGFLGCETTDQVLYESPSSKLRKILSSSNGGVDVSVANGVWVAKKLSPIQSGYAKILKSVYETKAGLFDFLNKPNEAVRQINSWCNKNTNGLIPTLVDKTDIDRYTQIVFANALYFKGSWSDPFDKTKKKDFHLINGEKTKKKKVSVSFMTSTNNHRTFDYGSFEDYKILKLPYKGQRRNQVFAMYVFLPHKKDGLQDLLQTFHSDPDLFRSSFDLENRKLDELWVPKFKISCKFEAHDVMKQMGLTLPFVPTNMELTRIVESRCPSDQDPLYVSKILQKSFIEIDEKGTKAAACSLMSERAFACAPRKKPPPETFVADHPFMFMVREDVSQTVFFVGVVLNPLA